MKREPRKTKRESKAALADVAVSVEAMRTDLLLADLCRRAELSGDGISWGSVTPTEAERGLQMGFQQVAPDAIAIRQDGVLYIARIKRQEIGQA